MHVLRFFKKATTVVAFCSLTVTMVHAGVLRDAFCGLYNTYYYKSDRGGRLFAVIRENQQEYFYTLIDEWCLEVNSRDWRGRTPLHYAADGYRNAFLFDLIASGADLNARDHEGNTPLLLACRSSSGREAIEVLLAAGTDVNARNNEGKTPLLLACWFSSGREAIEVLLAAGADVNAHDNEGKTPLLLACQSSPGREAIEVLLAAGADVNAHDNEGNTPLLLACRFSSGRDTMEVLLAAGAEVTANVREKFPQLVEEAERARAKKAQEQEL